MGVAQLRKAVIFLFAFATLVRPVAAADGLYAQEQQIKQQLAQVATAISTLDDKIARTQAEIDTTQQRVDKERGDVKALARTVYAQPASPLLAVFGARSPSDALTRYSDLKVAAARAAAAKAALDRDTVRLNADKANLEKDRATQVAMQQDLSQKYQQLADAIAAQAAQSQKPVPDQTQTPTAPATTANTPPAAQGSIQQIILDAFASQGAGAQAWALRIAKCESGYNPRAFNASSGAAGLFQFLPSTWRNMPQGKAGKDVFDPVANAQAAAYYYSTSGAGPWVCR
ncbi:MAG: transglycosylase SLT domain-containing protein [Candidatus Dormibacteraeota bacterium]|nr:transglycosylase SLT domain-containing protein [Candidatus Dormibacteraeota bacterium]